MKLLKKLWQWIFRRAKSPTVARAPSKRQPKEHFGSHYYLGDLLESLADVFSDLQKMKDINATAFGLYCKTGASVMSSDTKISKEIEPYFFEALPAFGCAFFGCESDEEWVGTRFGCFMKVKKPVNVQPSNGAIYCCTATYDLDGKVLADEFHVSVQGGHVKPLKQCSPKMHFVGRDAFCRMEWRFPEIIVKLADRHGLTIEEAAREIFALIVNASHTREQGMAVRVRKGPLTAAFSIDMLRTPYFFADREKSVNENGSTKRIIHFVKGHYRTVHGGEQKFIKPHFRGLREFEWNGYDVRVSMAGKHAMAWSEFDVATVEPIDASSDSISVEDAADKIERSFV